MKGGSNDGPKAWESQSDSSGTGKVMGIISMGRAGAASEPDMN